MGGGNLGLAVRGWALMATVTRERELLRELVALVRGECPSLLNEDSGGDVRLSMAIDAALACPQCGCGRPTTPDREYTKGLFVCEVCALEQELDACQQYMTALASPQAETMPTIQVGDVVVWRSGNSATVDAEFAGILGRQRDTDIIAIYRDPLWRRPAPPQAKED